MKSTYKMLMSIVSDEMMSEFGSRPLEELAVDYQYTFDPPILSIAFDRLYKLILKCGTKYYSISEEDLASISLGALDKCLQVFSPSRKIKFNTFFYTVLENELRRNCMNSNKDSAKANLDAVELDPAVVGEIGVQDSIQHLIPDGLLDDREKYMVNALIQGYTITDIAKHFGVCSTRASKIKAKLAKKLSYLLG